MADFFTPLITHAARTVSQSKHAMFTGLFPLGTVIASPILASSPAVGQMERFMRCLVVADLHYSLPQYDWVVNVAARFDLVVIAGDHIDLSSQVEGRAQTVVIRKYLELLRAKTKVITCSGNHDLDSRDALGEKVALWVSDVADLGVPTDGESLVIGDDLITICPWWDGPLARARIGEHLARDALKRKRRWFWVHHAPSSNSPTSWTGSRSFGDEALFGWVSQYRPDMVFSGHVHQSPFVKGGSWVDRMGDTWLFNVGQHLGAPPAHIVFDTDEQEAVWMSAAGIQSVRLTDPLEQPLPRLAAPPAWFMSSNQSGDLVGGQTRPGILAAAG